MIGLFEYFEINSDPQSFRLFDLSKLSLAAVIL